MFQEAPLAKSSPALDEPSTSGSSNNSATRTQAEEPRVPPLPEPPCSPARAPAYPSELEFMSNRKKKLLMKVQLQSNREGPGHIKLRVPADTLPSTSRVPPIGNFPDVTCRLYADPTLTTDRLPSIQNTRSVSSNLRSALVTNARVTRMENQPLITSDDLKNILAAIDADERRSTVEHSASTSSSQDFYLPDGSPLPSLVFTPTSKKYEGDCGSSEQSHDIETASQSRPKKDVDKVTSAKLLKIAGKFGHKKRAAGLELDDKEMDLLAQAVAGTQMEDEEIFSGSLPQASSHISEISDSTPDDRTYTGKSSTASASTEPHLTHKDQSVSKAVENPEETAEDCEEMKNVVKLASDVVDEYTAQAEGIQDRIIDGKLDSNSGLPDILPDSIWAVNIVPIIDIVNSSAAELKTTLEIGETAAVGDAGANDIGMIQSSKIVKSEADSPFTPGNEGAANEQQKASTQPRTAHSEVKSGDIPVEDGSSSISGDKKPADKQLKAPTIQKAASSQMEKKVIPVKDGQSALSHSRKVRGQKKSDDSLQTQLDDSPEGAAAVGGSKKKGVGDLIPVAENEKIDEKEKAIWEDKMLKNLGDLEFQLEIAGNHEAGENASPELDLNTSSRPHRVSDC